MTSEYTCTLLCVLMLIWQWQHCWWRQQWSIKRKKQPNKEKMMNICSSEVLKVEFCTWRHQSPRQKTHQEPRSTTVPVVQKPEEPFADIQVESEAQLEMEERWRKHVQRDSEKVDATPSRCLTSGVLSPRNIGVLYLTNLMALIQHWGIQLQVYRRLASHLTYLWNFDAFRVDVHTSLLFVMVTRDDLQSHELNKHIKAAADWMNPI